MHVCKRRIPACLIALMAGCAGNGEGLDENGRPIDGAPEPLVPEFSSIQDHVFTPICTTCHAGAAAPLGLRLEEGVAYAMLVDAPSVEAPDLLRVEPGNPDASYLIHKLEGSASVGARMPLNGPALPQATIDVIRQWIIDGALPPASAGSAADPVTLLAVQPVAGATLEEPPQEILLSANGELDLSLLHSGSVSLVRSGGDASFEDGNEVELAVRVLARRLDPTVVVVTMAEPAWVADRYRLVVSGSGASPVADREARLIDGDDDGIAGGDFTLEFNLEDVP